MSDVTVTQPQGWFARWKASRVAKKVAQTEQTIEDANRYFEAKESFDAEVAAFNSTPPKELIEAALVKLGLPGDITQVQGRMCVYSVPRGGKAKKAIESSHIIGIGLKDGVIGFSLEHQRRRGYPDLWYQDGQWYTWLILKDEWKGLAIHDFSLV